MFELVKKIVNSFQIGGQRKAAFQELMLTSGIHGVSNWQPADRKTLIEEGYAGNVIARWCVDRIAAAVSSTPVELRWGNSNTEVQPSHHLARLLREPNPMQSWSQLIEEAVIQLMTTGDVYFERIIGPSGRVVEIHAYTPDAAKYETDVNGSVVALTVRRGNRERTFPIDPVSRKSDILHVRLYNPLNPLFGLSPIRTAAIQIDQMNEANKWNYGILNKGVVLRGVLKVNSFIDDQMAEEYRSRFERAYSADRELKVAVFGEGVDYEQLDSSLQDLLVRDHISETARFICAAFGVPAYLLGLRDGSTFSNVSEARAMFYDNTVIPTTNNLYDQLSRWISQTTNRPVVYAPQWSQVPVIAERQRDVWAQMDKITFLSINEKRELAGLPPVDGGDVVVQPPNMIPVGEVVKPENNA